jgi:AAA domain
MSQSHRLDSQYEEPFPSPSAPGPDATQGPPAATMLLMVGLPGAGKTTRAKELAAANQALRLTPDHWMIPLFGEPLADGKRFVLEGARAVPGA